MLNIKTQIDANNILTITVDLNDEYGPSKSGKTEIIASSQGNQKIGNTDVVMGLNIYKKR